MGVDAGEGPVFGRRQLLTLLVGAAALGACGGGGSPKTQTGSAGSGGPAGTATGVTPTGRLEGPVVPDANRIPGERVTSWANRFAKSWKAAWKDDAGATGIADGQISIDPTRFAARGELSLSDGFLGAGSKIAPAVYDIDLAKVDHKADTHRLSSPQFGTVELTVLGFGAVKLVCTQIPDHPDIDRLEIAGQDEGGGRAVSVTYKIVRGGHVSRGAMALSPGRERPQAPEPGSANQQIDFIHGEYAASLVSAAALSKAVGVTAHAPEANGGKAGYGPGIDTSNARADTDNPQLIIQYTIYRASTAASARTFLEQYNVAGRPISGLGDGAYLIKAPVFLVVRQGNEVAQIDVVAPSGRDVASLDRAVAEALLPKLGRP